MVMKARVEGEPHPVIAADLSNDEWLELRVRAQKTARSGGRSRTCFCVDCGYPVHPRQHPRTPTRYFQHNPDSERTCDLAAGGEGPEHARLKTAVYRAAKRTRGWTADVEVPTGDRDNDTGRPAIVDVLATRDGVASPTRDDRRAFEVQLSSLHIGRLVSRQQIRERFAARSVWVTERRFEWSSKVPWFQVAKETPAHPYLVVDGVLSWDDGAGEFRPVPAFPASRMVPLVLRERLPWVDFIGGWRADGADAGRLARTRRLLAGSGSATAARSSTGRAAEWCDRTLVVPDVARGWSEEEWRRYARHAHERRRSGADLSDLDFAALVRFPLLEDLDDPIDDLVLASYDPMTDRRPCTHCGKVVDVTAAADYPLHHHCEWHLRRGDVCTAE
jgi:hypothetical protein